MLERVVQLVRRRHLDRLKARQHLADASEATYRDAVKGHDQFVDAMQAVAEPAFPFGTARDSTGIEVAIRIAPEDLFAHWLLQGGTGTGKTTLLIGLIAWALAQRLRVWWIDCKSGFYHSLIRCAGAIAYAMAPSERAAFLEHFTLINPFGNALIPLNACRVPVGSSAEVQSYDVTLVISRLFESALSTNMSNILRHTVQLLIASELSLVEAPAVLEDEALRGMLVDRFGTPVLKEFFFRSYPMLPDSSKHALSARLQSLLLPESLRLMLGADSLIDFSQLIAQGHVLGAFFGKGAGAPEELVNVIGSLVLQLILHGSYAAEGRYPPLILAIDEFHHLLAAPTLVDRFTTALSTLRSFRTHLMLVMHSFSQVPPNLRDALLTHCDRVAVFRSAASSAVHFGDFLPDIDPEIVADNLRRRQQVPSTTEMRRLMAERLQRLPNQHCFFYDRRRSYRSVLVRVADARTPEESVGISAAALDAFIAEHHIADGGQSVPREILRRQIAARRERLHQMLRPPIVVAAPESPTPPEKSPSRARRPRLG